MRVKIYSEWFDFDTRLGVCAALDPETDGQLRCAYTAPVNDPEKVAQALEKLATWIRKHGVEHGPEGT